MSVAGGSGGTALSTGGHVPRFSIGIPVRNGEASLARAIASIQAQTAHDLEIVISDNASTDATLSIVERAALSDPRIRIFRQAENIGAMGNFVEVLRRARGTYFMFLGHDDWIEPEYLERCLASLTSREYVALAAGAAFYHRGESVRPELRTMNLTSERRSWRVLHYLSRVHDNGVFYGLARREDLVRLSLEPVMGSDWLWVAQLAFLGQVVTRDDVSIHRGVGGSTRSYASIAAALKLPDWHARYPRTTTALAAFGDIAWNSAVYRELVPPARYALATAAVGALGVHVLRDFAGRMRADFRERRARSRPSSA